MKRWFFIFCSVILMSGCSIPLKDDRTQELFSLGAAVEMPKKEPQKLNAYLLVDDPISSPLYDSRRIVFRKSDLERGYYQYAQWDESVSRRFGSLFVRCIDSSGGFSSVGRRSGVGAGDFLLTSEIVSFDHAVQNPPGHVIVTLRTELSDVQKHKLCGSNTFEVTAQSSDYSARGAAEAFSKAVADLCGKVSEWVWQSAGECSSAAGPK